MTPPTGAPPAFAQTSCPELYQAQCADDPPGGQCLYLLPAGTAGPATLDLPATWSGPFSVGCYLFVSVPPAAGTESSFAQAAWEYLASPGRTGARFAWLSSSAGAPVQGPFLAVGIGGGLASTAAVTVFDFRNLSLVVGTGCRATLEAAGFQITPGNGGGRSLYLMAAWGETTLDVVDTNRGLSISVCGPQAGCLQGKVNLDLASDLASLDAGLHLYYRDPQWAAGDGDGAPFFLTSLRYPVITEAPGSLALYPSLDPLAPIDGTRTYFAFLDPTGQDPGSVLASNYRTNLGYGVSLTPVAPTQPGDPIPRLILVPSPAANQPSDSDPFALTPAGPFTVSAPGQTVAPPALMLGTSGVEYVELDAANANVLTFVPGQGAFAVNYAPPGSVTASQATDLDDAIATTSWVYLHSTTALSYYAQPVQSVLHQADPQQQIDQYLVYLPVYAGPVPTTPPAAAPAFPALPYVGVSAADVDASGALELQVVSACRRRRLYAIGQSAPELPAARAAPGGATGTWGKTPQGLVAFVEPSVWDTVYLAQDVTGAGLTLTNVEDQGQTNPAAYPLLSALTSSQLFLVISDPKSLVPFLTGGQVTLQGTAEGGTSTSWPFSLTPSQWVEGSTMLVFKFYDKPLLDLAKDTGTWAQGTSFNADPGATSTTLSTLLTSDVAKEDPTLQQVLATPSWRGILAFNVPVSVPSELEGLMAGIQGGDLLAHHLGFNLTPATLPTNPNDKSATPTLQTTSMFANIDYEDDRPFENDGFDFQYRLQKLRVLFQNSAVTDFQSTVLLQVNSLFGEPTTTAGGLNNILTLTGSRQADGYTFQTQAATTFTVTSKVLSAVTVSKAQFVTVDPGSTTTPVQSKFLFSGTVDFAAPAQGSSQFDAFSFGTDDGSGRAGLSFSGLSVDMTFPLDAPTDMAFAFDAATTSLDLATSQARQGSLFGHFPLTLKDLVQGKSGLTPGTTGYLDVASPATVGAVAYPWFGLVFDLDLGTIGALAGKAGFVASLITAWSPDPRNRRTFVGLQLPGSSGGNHLQISIEGVITITFKSIELDLTPSPSGPRYVLWLRNAALKLLSLTFPKSGEIDIVVFGDPAATAGRSTLGWFVAYANEPPCTPSEKAPTAPTAERSPVRPG